MHRFTNESHDFNPINRSNLLTTIADDGQIEKISEISRLSLLDPTGSGWSVKNIFERKSIIYEYQRRNDDGFITLFRHHKDETEWLEIQSADLSKEGSEVNSPGVTIITWYPALSQSQELDTGYVFNFQENDPDFNEWVAHNIKEFADHNVASLLNDFLRAAQISAETSRFKRAAHIIIEKLGRLGF